MNLWLLKDNKIKYPQKFKYQNYNLLHIQTKDFNARTPKKSLLTRRFFLILLLHAAMILWDNCGDFEIMKKIFGRLPMSLYWETRLGNNYKVSADNFFVFHLQHWAEANRLIIELKFSLNVVRARNKCSINLNWFIKASVVCVYTFAIITRLNFLRLQCDSLFSLEIASWKFFMDASDSDKSTSFLKYILSLCLMN